MNQTADLLKNVCNLESNTSKLVIIKILVDVHEIFSWDTRHDDKVHPALLPWQLWSLRLACIIKQFWSMSNLMNCINSTNFIKKVYFSSIAHILVIGIRLIRVYVSLNPGDICYHLITVIMIFHQSNMVKFMWDHP